MLTILSGIFIKNKNDYKNENTRKAYGIICGALGIFLNVCLCIFKFVAGSISGSIAVTADAFNNLSDAASSMVTMIGFKIAGQKPDSEHPFGHGRLEYVSGMVVSILIVLMGWELFKGAVKKIITPGAVEFSVIIFVLLAASICVKLYIAAYSFQIGKRISSPAMRATGIDALSDVAVTSIVLISGIIAECFDIHIDGYCGLVVACFVFWAGIRALRETVGPLLGQAPSPELIADIEKIVMCKDHTDKGILGMHDLIVHDYGPGRMVVSLDVEVSCSGDIMELHDIIDDIEKDISEHFNCYVTIHMDPVLTDDPETERMKAVVGSIADSIDKDNISFHDFRLVKDDLGSKLVFDIVLPYGYRMSDEEIIGQFTGEISKVNPGYICEIRIDKN